MTTEHANLTDRPDGHAASLRHVQNFIGGNLLDAASGRRMKLIDPCTGETFGSAPVSGDEDVDVAYRTAAKAFQSWGDTTPAERQRALLKLADAFEAHTAELVAAECENTGKPLASMHDEELPQLIDHIRFFAGACRLLEGSGAAEYATGFTSYVRREPVGVIGQVAPWNYPLMEAVWKVVPAIAAGNTVVLKPSDTTPVSTVLFATIAAQVLPPGVFNVVCGDRETGRALISHPIPAMVAITGSVGAGIDVAKTAATDLKRTHLELGGKAPVLVFADADLDAAAEAIVAAGFYNAGQDCTAATRVLVADAVADALTEAVARRARETKVGRPEEDVSYGPLNNAVQLARIQGLHQRLPAHARVITGGAQLGERGYFWQPTVITGLRDDDEMSRTEIFGPVVTIQRFSDEGAAIRCANDTVFGLASSVWTTDHGRAMRVARRLDTGTVWINAHTVTVAEMPHGGFKHSGYGKDLSVYGLEDYTRIKHVMHNNDI